MIRVLSFILVLCCSSALFAQQPTPSPRFAEHSIFISIPTPTPTTPPYPASSGFFALDQKLFSDVTEGRDHIDRIPNFPLGEKTVTLLVEEFDVLTNDAKILEGRKSGDRVVAAPKHILLHGSVEGDEGSHVYLAIFKDFCIGYIQPSKDERFLISPISKNTSEGVSPLICYRETDIDPSLRTKPWNCGAEELPSNQNRMDAISKEIADFQTKPRQEQQVQQVNLMRIAIECDYSYFQAHGNNLANAQSYAIAVLGTVCDVYLRDVHVGVTSQYLKVWVEANDPYPGPSAGDLLGQFRAYWNENMTPQPRAAALLFSAKGGGGLAYVGVLCAENIDSYNYAYCGLANNYVFPADGYIWDTDVSAHELGHNVGSLHTHNCSWKPAVDSCVGAEGSCYPTPKPRKGTIMSYCHLTSFGTEMKIHPRVATFMRSKAQRAGCLDWVEPPIPRAGTDQFICPGGQSKIGKGVDGGITPITYFWWPSAGLDRTNVEEVTAAPTKTTTYVMRVTDANGMRGYDTVTVFAQKPTVNAGADITTCGNDSVQLSSTATGTSSLKYQWIDQATTKTVGATPSIKVKVLKSAMYQLIVTDSVGCSNEDVINVVTKSKPFANISLSGSPSFCEGGSATLDAGAGFTNYKWSTGETSQTITVKKSGKYNCDVTTDGLGCNGGSDSIAITRHPIPPTPTIVKSNDTLVTSPSKVYQWSFNGSPISGASSQTYYPTVSGNYSVQITDSNGCQNKSALFSVTITPTGIVTDIENSDVKIYPNPAHSSLTIELPNHHLTNFAYFITDIRGDIIIPRQEVHSASESKEIINIKHLSAETYFLHYSLGKANYVFKFVKE